MSERKSIAELAADVGSGVPVAEACRGLSDAELLELRSACAHRVHRVAVSAVIDSRAAKPRSTTVLREDANA